MRLAITTLFVLALAAVASGQESKQKSPSFDAASLKPADPSGRGGINNFFTRPGGRLEGGGCTLEYLLMIAYKVGRSEILEEPKWLHEDQFDLVAVPPPGSKSASFIPKDPKLPPPPEELEMLQGLVAERFQLKVHEEIKDAPVYELVLKKRTSKLITPKDPETRPIVLTGYDDNKKGMYYFEGKNASMAVFAERLAGFLKRPVIDRTGLQDRYDFKVEYEETADSGIPFSTILQDLGLDLVDSKAPTRYIVIDHVDHLQQQ